MKKFQRIVLPEINEVLSKNLDLLQRYSEERFSTFDSNASDDAELIINTSLGMPVDEDAMLEWLSRMENSAVFYSDEAGGLREQMSDFTNVKLDDGCVGFTAETQIRLAERVEANIRNF